MTFHSCPFCYIKKASFNCSVNQSITDVTDVILFFFHFSLGGNCMTTMIATCSLEKKNLDVSILKTDITILRLSSLL